MASTRDQSSAADPAPRWLTADELDVWQAIHLLTLQLPAALDAQLQRDAQLSFLEYYVLVSLSARPGNAVRLSELAILTNAELSRISHLITRLEKRELVRRASDPADGRYTQAVLTEQGRSRLAVAALMHVATVRRLIIDILDTPALHFLRNSADHILDAIANAGLEKSPTPRRRPVDPAGLKIVMSDRPCDPRAISQGVFGGIWDHQRR